MPSPREVADFCCDSERASVSIHRDPRAILQRIRPVHDASLVFTGTVIVRTVSADALLYTARQASFSQFRGFLREGCTLGGSPGIFG